MFFLNNSDAPKGFYKEDNTTPNDVAVLESKQNSDAAGLLYQWGRKDPFTFANRTNGASGNNAFNPLKIYNAQGKEIVQHINGLSDTNGGITVVKDYASSMLETVRKPNTFYATWGFFIEQTGLKKDVWDYYWTSYSRGTDGTGGWGIAGNALVNNTYIDGYNHKRAKSVFDPCPYGFRVPTNGTYNVLSNSNISWKLYSHVAGLNFNMMSINSWFQCTGRRYPLDGRFSEVGSIISYMMSIPENAQNGYAFSFTDKNVVTFNAGWTKANGWSIRCIEECGISYF